MMDEATLSHLDKIVGEIDILVPKADSLVLIELTPKVLGYYITGNRSGLLRLGVELLRAGLLLKNNETILDHFEKETFIDTEYLRAEKEILFARKDSLQKREHTSNGERVLTRKERFQGVISDLIGAILFYGFIALAIIGLVTLGRWIF
jgi:hypothetical protein